MINEQARVFGPSKVDIYHEKTKAYLKGERIAPVTLEMDLTQRCTRACSGCPYGASRQKGLTLELPFIDRLFSVLGPFAPGIVLSGGESTIVPHFPQTLSLARAKGFKEIAVISNGGHVHRRAVQDALLEHVTSIRISLYDWQKKESDYFIKTLDTIEVLRNRIEKEGSKLEIGASMLTRTQWNHRYESVGLQAFNAGIDWLYFHPYCVDWDKERPFHADQTGVLEAIRKFKEAAPQSANIQIPIERYDTKPLYFEKLHGSHFLLEIGADGINYLGPECTYEKDAALLDLNEYLEDDFLWHPQRLKRIDEVNSDNYRFIGTRHRPSMFSDYIQQLIDRDSGSSQGPSLEASSECFAYPSII